MKTRVGKSGESRKLRSGLTTTIRRTRKTGLKKIENGSLNQGKGSQGISKTNKGGKIRVTLALTDGRNSRGTHLSSDGDLALTEAGVVDKGINPLGKSGFERVKGEGAGLVGVGHASSIAVEDVTVKR